MVDSYALRIERQLAPDEFRRLLSLVSEEKRERIRRFHFAADAHRTLLGDLLARRAICQRTGVRHEQIRIGHNPNGKPELVYPENLSFNISHAGEMVVCAVDRDPLGIDVERIRPFNLGVAERFFTPLEYADLLSKEDAAMARHFYRIWTLKESYLKKTGRGLSIPPDSFTLKISGGTATLSPELDGDRPSYFRLEEQEDYVIAICASIDSFGPLNISRFEEIIQFFTQHE